MSLTSKNKNEVEENDPMLYVAPRETPKEVESEPYNPAEWIDYYEESNLGRIKRKMLENPFIPAGAALTTGTRITFTYGCFGYYSYYARSGAQ